MKTITVILVATIGISLLAGCAITPVTLDSVGPAPTRSKPSQFVSTGQGWLRVYTATKVVPDGKDSYSYPHTGYRIYTESGRLLEYVPNHVDPVDESVTLVRIPAGKYNVLARSEPYNLVLVPIVIQAGKTTEVHLGAHWKAPTNVSTNQIVYFPDGRPVGWKGSLADSSR